MKFATEIDDAQIASLAAPIARQLQSDPAKREVLARIALQQMVAWMAGRTSYQSISEMQAEWLLQLLPAFYPGEPPSAERLFNDFGISYGRAGYLARVLLERQQTQWRQLGRKALREAVQAAQQEAAANLANGDAEKTVSIPLDGAAYRELKVVLAGLDAADPLQRYVTTRSAGPVRRLIGLPSGLVGTILARLEA